jgi:polyvinyl alcohol dehydrogenase (cytochrome)
VKTVDSYRWVCGQVETVCVVKHAKRQRWAMGLFCISVLIWPAPMFAQDGAALFKTHCALCHEADDHRAPTRDVLAQLSPEQILQVLEKGSMRTQAAERSRAQRRQLAEYLSGKKFGSATVNVIPASAYCTRRSLFTKAVGESAWNGWGVTVANTRFQSAASAGVSEKDVPRLTLKWAFGFPGARSASSQPVVVGGRVYISSVEGEFYSLDANTGCIHWMIETEAGVRGAASLGQTRSDMSTVFFGDQAANVYAVDAESGKLLWKVKADDYPLAAITGSLTLYAGRVYVPISSREESQVTVPNYQCCRFRGSVVALDASTGRVIWKSYTIADEATPRQRNHAGAQLWGPSGAAIWTAPTVDIVRKVLYVATGNNYSAPATPTSDAIIAMDLNSGRIEWVQQQTQDDIWTWNCLPGYRDATACPDGNAPDFDFASSPILVQPTNGQRMLITANKSGSIVAVDPDHEGKKVWQVTVASGGGSGGIMWGPAADSDRVYVAITGRTAEVRSGRSSGGLTAIKLASGQPMWRAPDQPCGERSPCNPAQPAAVTAIPGVVFSGTIDGQLRAYSTQDGHVLWEYNTARDFATVNGVTAQGGSINNGGPAIAGGMVFVNSGYSHHEGIMPGNVLLAFSFDSDGR